MDDEKLDELLADAVRSYRPPPAAPLDAIWSRVEAEAFDARPGRRAPGWRAFAGAIAATLVLGVLIGRTTAARSAPTLSGTAPASAHARLVSTGPADPYQRTTQEFLGRTATLLVALPSKDHPGTNDAKLAGQAQQLLGTTRLLLDSPVGRDQRMKDLLEDLELVLAQVARLQPQRPGESLTLINEALEERDVVPRIRSAVADLSGSDH
ncbi:MAG TPA: hypothetical protein VGI97_01440 [Gemmatimonadaceae bacterium]|jgi:hypothetical protein